MRTKVLVAGLAGASLGTEVVKCLFDADAYAIYGCDISPLAYGMYSDKLEKTFVADKDDYINSIIDICRNNDIRYIVPGGEQPMVLLAQSNEKLLANSILVASNKADIVELFSDKAKTFEFLQSLGFKTPYTVSIASSTDEKLATVRFPCIVKPSKGSGGSDSVFLANSLDECELYIELLKRNGKEVIIQEYIGHEEGEYTIGVLSDSKEHVIGSVCMKREFNSKLSVAYKGAKGLISSGYSQGLIGDFPELRKQAELIAMRSKSTGPLNIQGRIKDGMLVPFEINPRFSASTYLRTKAGFNEIHFYLQHLISGQEKFDFSVKEGYYLRSFEETYIPLSAVKGSAND